MVAGAAGSALVKLGCTTVLAGVTALCGPPPRATPAAGALLLAVELPPLCSAAASRPGRPSDEAAELTERLRAVLTSARLPDPGQLCILEARAARGWVC